MAAYDNVQLPGAPSPGTYAPTPIDFSAISQIPKAYQEGQQYSVQRKLQTMFPDGNMPRDQQGNIDMGAIASKALAVGGPQAAQPYMQMMLQQQSSRAVQDAITGQPGQPQPQQQQGQQPQPPQPQGAPAPAQSAGEPPPNTIRGMMTAGYGDADAKRISDAVAKAYGVGADDPLNDQQAEQIRQRFPKVVQQAQANAPQTDMQTKGGPPFAPGTPSARSPNGGAFADNETIMPTGGAQPAAASVDPRMARADMLEQQASKAFAAAAGIGVNPEQAKAATARGEALTKSAQQLREAALKDQELTPAAKDLNSGTIQKTKELEGDIARSQKTYGGMHAISNQFETGLEPAIQVAKGILNRPEMYSGIGGSFALDFNKVKAVLGDKSAATLQEGLQKINAISVLAQVNQQKDEMQETGATSSRIFSQQVDQVAKASASMENTVNGNRFLVNFQDRMGQFSKALTAQAQAYIQAHGHLDVGFDKQVSNYIGKNPIFTPKEIADPRILGAPDAPAGQTSKAEVLAWAGKMGLKSGDPFKTPAGDVRYVP